MQSLRKHGFFFYDSGDYVRNSQAFHSHGIGQFDALYIKPSSVHLPKWLVDNNIQFCGMGNTKGEESTVTDISKCLSGEGNGKSFPIMMQVLASFLGGYMAGSFVNKRKGILKRNWEEIDLNKKIEAVHTLVG